MVVTKTLLWEAMLAMLLLDLGVEELNQVSIGSAADRGGGVRPLLGEGGDVEGSRPEETRSCGPQWCCPAKTLLPHHAACQM